LKEDLLRGKPLFFEMGLRKKIGTRASETLERDFTYDEIGGTKKSASPLRKRGSPEGNYDYPEDKLEKGSFLCK